MELGERTPTYGTLHESDSLCDTSVNSSLLNRVEDVERGELEPDTEQSMEPSEESSLLPHDDTNVGSTPGTRYASLSAKLRYVLKLVIPSLVLLTAVYFFAMQPERGDESGFLAVSQSQPQVISIDPSSTHDSIEYDIKLQKRTMEKHLCVGLQLTVKEFDGDWLNLGDRRTLALSEDEEVHEIDEIKYYEYYDPSASVEEILLNITTNSETPIGFALEINLLGEEARYQVLMAALVLFVVYGLIIFEVMHRTIAAMLGSFLTLGLVSQIHYRPSIEEVVTWIDYETVTLLFGMNCMVGIFSTTGVFQVAAVQAYKFAKGKMWRLIVVLCLFTAITSAFLDNVTTMLLVSPVTISLCRVIEIDPRPILLAEVIFSNIGGAATAVGDPPNIIIVSNAVIKGAGISFLDFSLRVAPGVIIAYCVSFFAFSKLFRKSIIKDVPHADLINEIQCWRNTLSRQPKTTIEERSVRQQMTEHIEKLKAQLKELESQPSSGHTKTVEVLEHQYQITDKPLFFNSSLVVSCVIIMFFLHGVMGVDLSLGWIAITGCCTLLLLSGIKEIEEVLDKVEWGTLLFFAALFVLMQGLEELGLVSFIGDLTSQMIEGVPEGPRLAVSISIILWVSALVSAFIDNIPFTQMMIPVVIQLARNTELSLPLRPLVYALVFGTCLGGNGSLVGASANVVTVGVSDQHGYPISFLQFFKFGFPIMLVSIFSCNIYLLFVHCVLGIDDDLLDNSATDNAVCE
eukprot:GCRY01002018.1.p1 GENE.GCRY01002018.1~~GCRY01002018.1.p1  ORF type:complete len:742 (+),score=205.79 GCRY01002018.1:161-2386(+)